MSAPFLICIAGPRQGDRFEITPAGLRIGREASCEVHLQDPDVSRSHARVVLHNGAVWIQDAGSRNGVFVNEQRVVEHKQVKEGDRISVGIHQFNLEVVRAATPPPAEPAAEPKKKSKRELRKERKQQEAEQKKAAKAAKATPAQQPGVADEGDSVDLSALAKPEKKWKIWPFAVAGILVVGGIGGIAVMGQNAGPEINPATGGYSLSEALNGDAGDAKSESLSLAETLAMEGMPTEDKWGAPPKGATAESLTEAAGNHYQAGRLREALKNYHQALKLDEDCEICVLRIERITGELNEQIAFHYDAGKRYYDSLRYREAIGSFELVLQLEPDPGAPIHKQTVEYLERARKKLEAQQN